jgi:hypothetical protein
MAELQFTRNGTPMAGVSSHGSNRRREEDTHMRKLVLIAALLVVGSTAALAQGEPPRLGDANPPGALRQGGVPPAAVLRRDDAMAPMIQRDVSGNFGPGYYRGRPQEFGNNPTPTWNDPPGTRTQCRGGC